MTMIFPWGVFGVKILAGFFPAFPVVWGLGAGVHVQVDDGNRCHIQAKAGFEGTDTVVDLLECSFHLRIEAADLFPDPSRDEEVGGVDHGGKSICKAIVIEFPFVAVDCIVAQGGDDVGYVSIAEAVVVATEEPVPYTFTPCSPMVQRTSIAGSGSALNHGAAWGKRIWDWLLCCNNDCLCNGNVTDIIATLRDDTIYGNKWKFDYDGFTDGLPAVVDSAYFLIPRRVWEKIGGFDPKMEAAFEEIDYCIRALEAGFRLDVAPIPIVHLNMHTRTETPDYWKRWEETRQYFHSKHPARKDHGHPAESDR